MREHFIHGLVDDLKSIQCKKRGFSLIELLVVFAIFAILLSLLGSTLKKISDTARDVNCINNQKQIGLGTHVYLEDFEGQFFAPQNRSFGYNRNPGGDWYDLVRPYVTPGHGVFPKNIQYASTFFCPSIQATKHRPFNPNLPISTQQTPWTTSDYAINKQLTGSSDSRSRPFAIKMVNVINPSRVALFFNGMRNTNPNWFRGNYRYALLVTPSSVYQDCLIVHRGQSPTCLVDGHVEMNDPWIDIGWDANQSLARGKPIQFFFD